MAIRINVADKVGFAVKGSSNDADGAEQAFDFTLTAKRLNESALQALQAELLAASKNVDGSTLLQHKLSELVTNWSGVRDETDAPLPYSPSGLQQLCQAYKGLAVLIWHAYVDNVGAKVKN